MIVILVRNDGGLSRVRFIPLRVGTAGGPLGRSSALHPSPSDVRGRRSVSSPRMALSSYRRSSHSSTCGTAAMGVCWWLASTSMRVPRE